MENGPATVWDLAKYNNAVPTQQIHGMSWRKLLIHEDNRASIRLGWGFQLGRGAGAGPSRPTNTWTVAVQLLPNHIMDWSCGLHHRETEGEDMSHCVCVNVLLTKLALSR